MHKKYVVMLTTEQRELLRKMVNTRKEARAQKLTRARILLMTDSGNGRDEFDDESVSRALSVSTATVQRVRQQFVEEGLEAAIEYRQPQRSYEKKLNQEAEALLVVLFYTDPPAGSNRWTARLLADKLIEVGYVDYISGKTVQKALRSSGLSLGS